MKLNEALAVIHSQKSGGSPKVHYLASGFEPLHLATFLKAELLQRLPEDGAEVLTGMYGDLVGNLGLAAASPAIAAAAVLEWSDIDPRLGLRSSGGWSVEAKADIVVTAQQSLGRLEAALAKLGARMPVAVAPPSLPMPPIGNTVRAQRSVLELELEQQLASFLLRIAHFPGVRVIHFSGGADAAEPLDVKMELAAGFPYTVPFASALAASLVDVLWQRSPKKGLITDLDDTLWAGIVGEIGIDGVSWGQDHHTQIHGLYQQMLGHLAACGVLLAVCSKNELSIVEAALARQDLFVKMDSLFPVCANWEPKSKSIARILSAWNIGEGDVVFVDDSPMELAEVKPAFPGMTCLQFPRKDPAKVWKLLGELRDLFGKPLVLEEDRLRQASLRAAGQIQEMGEAAASPEFLRALQGTVTIDWRLDPADKRPLELINKTNQFNLNGLRMSEGEWQRLEAQPGSVVGVISYADKFGPLGKVAVLAGAQSGSTFKVSHWVMSCRAFSRRLEHHTLDSVFTYCDASEIEFEFQATERNGPLREFLRALGVVADGEGRWRISRAEFLERCGTLPHRVEISGLRGMNA